MAHAAGTSQSELRRCRIVVAFGFKAHDMKLWKKGRWPSGRGRASLRRRGKPEHEAGAIPNLKAIERALAL